MEINHLIFWIIGITIIGFVFIIIHINRTFKNMFNMVDDIKSDIKQVCTEIKIIKDSSET